MISLDDLEANRSYSDLDMKEIHLDGMAEAEYLLCKKVKDILETEWNNAFNDNERVCITRIRVRLQREFGRTF